MDPGVKLGTGGAPLIKSDLDKAHFTTTPLETVNVVTRQIWRLKNIASRLKQF